MSALKTPEFQALLVDLTSEERRKKKRRPNRFEARALMLALGTALLEGDPEVENSLERVRKMLEPERESWQAAFDEELTLAVTEHVRSCDPGFLKHPRYDFPYTVAARQRLEERLQAADALDLAASETLLDQIERADQILAPYLASRDASGRS